MKNVIKKALVLMSALILISCQNDFDDNLSNLGSSILQTKSSTSVPSVLTQISEIPVNLILKGGNPYNYYLSAKPKDNAVVLYNKDDGSLRQRWLINSSGIRVEGGAHTNGYIIPIGKIGNYVPKLINNGQWTQIHFEEGDVESTYHICTSASGVHQFLYSIDAKNNGLAFAEKSKTGGRDVWEIVPVETFTLRDISYFQGIGDRVDSSLVFLRNYYLDNSLNSVPANHKVTISESLKSISQFSKVTGMNMSNKISNSTSFKVGLPSVDINGNVNYEQLTQTTWSYSITDSEERSINWVDEFSTVVPANKLMVLQVLMQKYEFDISYVGTLVGNTTGRTIKLKGRWRGSFGTNIIYKPVVNGISVNNIEKRIIK